MQTTLNEKYLNVPAQPTNPWDERLASWISNIFCPPVTVMIGLFLVVLSIHELVAWAWALITLVLTIGIPMIYILWKVRSGEISDFHIPVRTQRFRPMALTILCALMAWAILWEGNAPKLLLSMMAWGVFQASMMLVITLRWKISGHSAAISGLAILLVRLLGPALYPALLFIPLVAWARIRIRRHTFTQTIAGAILGILYIILVLK